MHDVLHVTFDVVDAFFIIIGQKIQKINKIQESIVGWQNEGNCTIGGEKNLGLGNIIIGQKTVRNRSRQHQQIC